MTERKPPQIEFFLPGTSDREIERIQREKTLAEGMREESRVQIASEADLMQIQGDDPDRLLDAFVQVQGPLAGAKLDVDVATEAKMARHNAHTTQLRMIEMEKRRQTRERRTGKREKQ